MKKQSIVIQINSFSDLDKNELIELIEKQLPIGIFVSSIKAIGSCLRNMIDFNKLNQKKMSIVKQTIVNNGYAHVVFTYQIY